ncbi:hypothetical protein Tco_1042720 [Tanacetum coccineum]|uniref:Hexosyltransferase n=1 Tax=Tanacetum coccineum TaxID=301880 RepID=A0ABQ5GJY2_9ASTR
MVAHYSATQMKPFHMLKSMFYPRANSRMSQIVGSTDSFAIFLDAGRMGRKLYIKAFCIVLLLAFAASEVHWKADTSWRMQDQLWVVVSISDYRISRHVRYDQSALGMITIVLLYSGNVKDIVDHRKSPDMLHLTFARGRTRDQSRAVHTGLDRMAWSGGGVRSQEVRGSVEELPVIMLAVAGDNLYGVAHSLLKDSSDAVKSRVFICRGGGDVCGDRHWTWRGIQYSGRVHKLRGPYVEYGELQYWCFPSLVDVMLSYFYLADKMDTNGLCHISAWVIL